MRSSKTLALPAAALLVGVLTAMAATPGAKPTLEQVGNQVYCQCGCVTVLNHCPHLPSECQSRAQMQTAILADIQQGKADPAILKDLVDRFGVHVLASPPATGFNLTVWVLPGVALIIGLAIVLAIVRRWRAKVVAVREPVPDGPVDDKIMAAVEEEMNDLAAPKAPKG